MKRWIKSLIAPRPTSPIRTTTKLRIESLETRAVMSSVTGDFNHDGYKDLAIGVPEESGQYVGDSSYGVHEAGMVRVIYGSANGLKVSTEQIWTERNIGSLSGNGADERFGAALAAGDFNGDGFDDLSIGAPGEKVNGVAGAGAVFLLKGSGFGLWSSGAQMITQPQLVGQTAEANDHFGAVLAAGDFNGDGKDDLAVGTPDENVGAVSNAGAVYVLSGSATGLQTSTYQVWTQDSANVPDTAESDDAFGFALAAGDFNGDGKDDLAVGVPFESIGGAYYAGGVHVLYGSANRLTGNGSDFWTQASAGNSLSNEAGDAFGFALAAGDFNGDGRADLAVGIPYEDVGTAANAGAVQVLMGSIGGITMSKNKVLTQDTDYMKSSAEAMDYFGKTLTTGDINGDGRADLVIGSPGEDEGNVANAGAVHLVFGAAGGVTTLGSQLWTASGVTGKTTYQLYPFQNSPVTRDYYSGAEFGTTLAAGDFNGDGYDDLVVEAPGIALDWGAANGSYGPWTDPVFVLKGTPGGLINTDWKSFKTFGPTPGPS